MQRVDELLEAVEVCRRGKAAPKSFSLSGPSGFTHITHVGRDGAGSGSSSSASPSAASAPAPAAAAAAASPRGAGAVPPPPPTAPVPVSFSLPPNWVQSETPDGRLYFFNELTLQTSWSPPDGAVQQKEGSAASPAPGGGGGLSTVKVHFQTAAMHKVLPLTRGMTTAAVTDKLRDVFSQAKISFADGEYRLFMWHAGKVVHVFEPSQPPLPIFETGPPGTMLMFDSNVDRCASEGKTAFHSGHVYRCKECASTVAHGMCSVCARTCHAGHTLAYSGFSTAFFCTCGIATGAVPCTTSASIKVEPGTGAAPPPPPGVHHFQASASIGALPGESRGRSMTLSVHQHKYPEHPADGSVLQIPIGELIFGEPIGKGSYGAVFHGSWGHYPVAIKRLEVLDSQEDYESELQEYQAESSIMRKLPRHPNVLTLVGITAPPDLCICLELMERRDLASLLKSRETVSVAQQLEWSRGLGAGLRHVHENNIVHRDVACRNVLLDRDYTPKLGDFGLAAPVANASVMTEVALNKWLAPEAIGERTYGFASDCWAYGVCIYEICTGGGIPFSGMDAMQAAMRVANEGLLPDIPQVPESLSVLTLAMQMTFVTDPAQRSTMQEVCQALG
mmetsp:Transcript_4875/g.15736  ORF Transcript_4875/g.15736 Transcript_4875/m.15736 type:complete len:618 (-) Transcript_4875:36-1889(-)